MTNIQRVFSGRELRTCEHVHPPEETSWIFVMGLEYTFIIPHTITNLSKCISNYETNIHVLMK